ncbi:MAG: DUF1684 domain-containing protein [Candidatus Dormibacteraeota bacterium]|nr:DUF1684 domain-containing protein [Candidatus Dormibacteraeota bacterium]
MDERLQLLDWRRRTAELYATVRADPDIEHAWHVWRAARELMFLEHPQSPLPAAERDAGHAPAYYDYDPAYRGMARVTESDASAVQVPASVGDGYRLVRAGTAHMVVPGEALELQLLWLDDYAGGLLLTCRDATSGAETYGAGRYLLDTAKGADLGPADGGIVVDFNFAYQPSCSYDPRWNCPLAPRENWLTFAIRAGERLRQP